MALLFALRALGYRKLILCHLDHRLRGADAEADSRLVSTLATKFHQPFELGEADVRVHAEEQKLSIEVAARALRHAFFQSCAKAHRCRRIFLAHHADDQIETCLFNFLRGTGATGLTGMKPLAHVGGLEIHSSPARNHSWGNHEIYRRERHPVSGGSNQRHFRSYAQSNQGPGHSRP